MEGKKAETGKIRVLVLLLVLCLVLVNFSIPRRLSQLIPLSDVSAVTVIWTEVPFTENQEHKTVEIKGDQLSHLRSYLEQLRFRPCTLGEEIRLKAPVYHLYFTAGDKQIGIWITVEGIAEIGGKYYRISPWDQESPTTLKALFLSAQ